MIYLNNLTGSELHHDFIILSENIYNLIFNKHI